MRRPPRTTLLPCTTLFTSVEAFIELSRERKGRVVLYHPGLNQSMNAVQEMITNPTVAMGLGDSGAHVGQIMDASSPTWLLSYWVRDKQVMSLEEAVRGWTGDTAQIFGITDRGVLREGARADTNVLYIRELAVALPEYKHAYPGRAGRYLPRGTALHPLLPN